jgi:hypothetical protein
MTVRTTGLDREQAALARAYCAAWTLYQGQDGLLDVLEDDAMTRYMNIVRRMMTVEASLRCSQFERGYNREGANGTVR